MARKSNPEPDFDRELADLPPELRWREWKARVEAVLFAAAKPVTRDILARVVGRDCALELLLDDLKEDLRGRPIELVRAGESFTLHTRPAFGPAIRAAFDIPADAKELTKLEAGVLMAVAMFQPVTRGEISEMFGREISRDLIASLREEGLIAAGPRSPKLGAPYAYVTTEKFLFEFGFESLRDLPDLEKLEDAGLLGTASRDEPGRAGLALEEISGRYEKSRAGLDCPLNQWKYLIRRSAVCRWVLCVAPCVVDPEELWRLWIEDDGEFPRERSRELFRIAICRQHRWPGLRRLLTFRRLALREGVQDCARLSRERSCGEPPSRPSVGDHRPLCSKLVGPVSMREHLADRSSRLGHRGAELAYAGAASSGFGGRSNHSQISGSVRRLLLRMLL